MNTVRLITAAAMAAALAAPLAARADPNVPDSAVNAPSATNAGSPVAATVGDPAAPLGTPSHPIPQSSPTPSDQASILVAGDSSVVSNGPVPDTPANRARYGQPLSMSGRLTKPVSN